MEHKHSILFLNDVLENIEKKRVQSIKELPRVEYYGDMNIDTVNMWYSTVVEYVKKNKPISFVKSLCISEINDQIVLVEYEYSTNRIVPEEFSIKIITEYTLN